MSEQADRLAARLAEAGAPERAIAERAYLKTDLTHWGVRTGDCRRIVRAYAKQLPPDHDALVDLAAELWAEPVYERRRAAVELLRDRPELLDADDLPLVERLLREARTWALVDDLAEHVAGPIAETDSRSGQTLDRWAFEEDFWLRRAAMLALLVPLRRGEGDWERFTGYAEPMLGEREFFIRKAIGWILRDTGKARPELVADWVRPRITEMSGVTVREAVKPLPPDVREDLLSAWRARAGAPRPTTARR